MYYTKKHAISTRLDSNTLSFSIQNNGNIPYHTLDNLCVTDNHSKNNWLIERSTVKTLVLEQPSLSRWVYASTKKHLFHRSRLNHHYSPRSFINLLTSLGSLNGFYFATCFVFKPTMSANFGAVGLYGYCLTVLFNIIVLGLNTSPLPTRLTLVMAVALPLTPVAGSFVTCTVKCSLSTSGHAPCALHVSTAPSKVLRCGSPNNTHSRCVARTPCDDFRYAHASWRPRGGVVPRGLGLKTSPRLLQLNNFIWRSMPRCAEW